MTFTASRVLRFAAKTLGYFLLLAVVAVLALSTVGRGMFARGSRSKVSRVLGDLREMRTAVESYAADLGAYPRMSWGDCFADTQFAAKAVAPDERQRVWGTLVVGFEGADNPEAIYGGSVTTPISYVTTVFHDAFEHEAPRGNPTRLGGHYMYWNLWQYKGMLEAGRIERTGARFPYAPRADQIETFAEAFGTYVIVSAGPTGWDDVVAGKRPLFVQYDPTNGAQSAGSIFVSQKETKPVWVDALALEP